MGHEGAEQALTEHRNAGLALVLICAVQMMVILDGTIVNIALPSIQHQLHFSAPGLEWVITAYALTFGGLLLLGGRSGDLFGRRRMFTIGVVIFCTVIARWLRVRHRPAVAHRRPGGARRRGRHRLAHGLGLDPEHLPRGAQTVARHGRLCGDVGRGRVARPAARRHPDRCRLVAMGAVRERPHRVGRRHRRPEGARHHAHPPRAPRPSRRCRSPWGMASLVYGLSRAATAGWADHVTRSRPNSTWRSCC